MRLSRDFLRLSIHLTRRVILISVFFSLPSSALAQNLSAMRITFLQAEQYIRQERNEDYFALADTLKNYPLYPYLQYQWLVRHLDDTASVLDFLHDYPASRYASALHDQWLIYLGKQKQWLLFLNHYKHTKNPSLACYFAEAQLQIGQQQDALDFARQAWISGLPQPEACDGLFDRFKKSAQFSSALVWQRFTAALQLNHPELAKYLLQLLPPEEQATANIWLKLHHNPEQVRQSADWKTSYTDAGVLFAHAIQRWLENDLNAALDTWDEQKDQFKIPAEIVSDTEKRLGIHLALKRDPRSIAKLTQFAGSDSIAKQWRIRAALSLQNWPEVLTGIADLNASEKNEDRWQYWQAKALLGTGQQQQAISILQAIAKHRSLYAFMAADYLHQDIELAHNPIAVSESSLSQLKNSPEFLSIQELLFIDRKPEATRQWWHAVAVMNPQELSAAAKLAQQWQWPSMTIFTLAQANLWDDMELRFPLHYNVEVTANAAVQQLDPALLFALIRQESAFDALAGSPAGAMGLMQIMPQTAQHIAKTLKQNWQNDNNLLLPELNIRYGSYYFKNLLNQFNGHVVLATAAYNAGANRIKQWRPQKQALPADIWIETIPFKETRSYVSSVLMYTLIYQQRLNRNSLKISELMLPINPG
ncbi:MAG: lytic murein transglycosylase [Methylomonas sp.]|nr:MAG: lytic murein transglycosylase [Methylomonas sp.]